MYSTSNSNDHYCDSLVDVRYLSLPNMLSNFQLMYNDMCKSEKLIVFFAH
jgi:hypothetical protein